MGVESSFQSSMTPPTGTDGDQGPSGSPSGIHSVIPSREHRQIAFLVDLPLGRIVPNEFQPRTDFDEEALESLTRSVRELGVLQPILVRDLGDGSYEIVAGERRWRASERAGRSTIPAVVRQIDDQTSLEQALVENVQRHDLHAMEEAAAYRQLMDEFGLTQDEVAKRVGKSRSSVANTVRLLLLPSTVQRMVAIGRLGAGHARALLSLERPEDQISLADQAVAEQLSVRQMEALVRTAAIGQPMGNLADAQTSAQGLDGGVGGSSGGRYGPDMAPSAAVLEVQQILSDLLQTRVGVSMGRQIGRITIDVADLEDLGRIYKLLVPTERDEQ